jgi:hypothetical protein
MKKLLIILLLIFITGTAKAQSYQTKEVIEKAESYLKLAVGDELFKYFQLDPNSYYEYKTRLGRKNWRSINKGSKTKGDFVNGQNMRFTLKHPEFPHPTTVTVPLTSDLSLESKINLDRVPDFLLEGRESDWLRAEQIDSVVNKQNLKVAKEKPRKYLEYDSKEKTYYWKVINTLKEEKCSSDVEILIIQPKSGEVLKHSEERLFVLHCY